MERISFDIRGVVGISLVGLQGLPEKDWFAMGYVSWRAADGVTLLAGTVLFGGPDGSRFGSARDLSRVFVEIKYAW